MILVVENRGISTKALELHTKTKIDCPQKNLF
jgi:hypothetical protein